VHGYIENARVTWTGTRREHGGYFEARVESGETPQAMQSFTLDRPFMSPIHQNVWFSMT
jgi:hypothetical protein